MSRNQLYKERIELCVTSEQRKKVERIAKLKGFRINEVIRMMINSWGDEVWTKDLNSLSGNYQKT